jgi:hypothetical protein
MTDYLYQVLIGALGIISKTITAPYWRCVGDSDINVLHIGSIYEQLIDLLTNGANNYWNIIYALFPQISESIQWVS